MPPRLRLQPLSATTTTRLLLLRRPYSSQAPLVRVTDVPAPNSGHIRVLELNRPSARNAISKALLSELRAEIDRIGAQYGPRGEELPPAQRFGGAAGVDEKGPTRALVVASAVDACFCAGADLKERRTFTEAEFVTPPHLNTNPIKTPQLIQIIQDQRLPQ
jgi:methylglutaconyl-CoA hydratase